MASDARFGIELYGHPGETQTVEGETATVVGHVWSPDAERIVELPGGSVLVIDPSGANATSLNSSISDTEVFLEAFRVFYLGDRPGVVPPMTVDEARARLASLQRGETPAVKVAPVPASRANRVATLRRDLGACDPAALIDGSWWSRILERPEFDEA